MHDVSIARQDRTARRSLMGGVRTALIASWVLVAALAAQAACRAPAKALAWQSAVRDGGLLSLNVDSAGFEVRRGAQGGPPGHWLHLSDSGPVNGALAWWPCGARRTAWAATGGFGAWRTGPKMTGAGLRFLWLETQRYGTGLQVTEAIWAVPAASRAMVIWHGTVSEKFSGPLELDIERELKPLPDGTWSLVERRVQEGREVPVAAKRLCLSERKPNLLAPKLEPCRARRRQAA